MYGHDTAAPPNLNPKRFYSAYTPHCMLHPVLTINYMPPLSSAKQPSLTITDRACINVQVSGFHTLEQAGCAATDGKGMSGLGC